MDPFDLFSFVKPRALKDHPFRFMLVVWIVTTIGVMAPIQAVLPGIDGMAALVGISVVLFVILMAVGAFMVVLRRLFEWLSEARPATTVQSIGVEPELRTKAVLKQGSAQPPPLSPQFPATRAIRESSVSVAATPTFAPLASESNRALADRSYGKQNWGAARALYAKCIDEGDHSTEVVQRVVECIQLESRDSRFNEQLFRGLYEKLASRNAPEAAALVESLAETNFSKMQSAAKAERRAPISPHLSLHSLWHLIRSHAHWLFALTLCPLFYFSASSETVEAYLPADTQMHLAYAALSAVGFLALISVSFPRSSVTVSRLVLSSMFVGTIGLVLLVVFQLCVDYSFRYDLFGSGWKGFIVLGTLRIISFSYHCVADPSVAPALKVFGYIFGVGLCEELCKALPVLNANSARKLWKWQDAASLGLACGVGFGVSEGILYSVRNYNGHSGVSDYLIRFISLVGMHAMWSGVAAIIVFKVNVTWRSSFFKIVLCLLLPILGHGVYDAFITNAEYYEAGQYVAAGAFVVWALLVSWCRSSRNG